LKNETESTDTFSFGTIDLSGFNVADQLQFS